MQGETDALRARVRSNGETSLVPRWKKESYKKTRMQLLSFAKGRGRAKKKLGVKRVVGAVSDLVDDRGSPSL